MTEENLTPSINSLVRPMFAALILGWCLLLFTPTFIFGIVFEIVALILAIGCFVKKDTKMGIRGLLLCLLVSPAIFYIGLFVFAKLLV